MLIAAKILTRLQVPLMLGDSSQLWESGCQFAWYLSEIKMFLTGRLGSYFKCPVFTECAAGNLSLQRETLFFLPTLIPSVLIHSPGSWAQ